MRRFNRSVVLQFDSSSTGNSGANLPITVRFSDTKLKATLYGANDAIPENEIPNPTFSDDQGNYTFFVANGVYDVIINEGQAGTYTLLDEQITDSSTANPSTPFSFTATAGQTEFILPAILGDTPSVESVNLEGSHQDPLGNASSAVSYTVTDNKIILSESASEGELLTGSANPISTSQQLDVPLGDIGNPFQYSTLYDFVNTLPYINIFKEGQWIQFNGRTILGDGHTSRYQVTGAAPTIRRNYENYIPLNGDGADVGVTLWAVLREGFKRDFYAQPIEIIAHRGFGNIGTDNSIHNYSAAQDYQHDTVEVDVQVTSDGQVVCFHDLVLENETNGTGEIINHTYAQVRALTYNDLAGTFWHDKMKIDRLEDVLDIVAKGNKRVQIEIKALRMLSDMQLVLDLVSAKRWDNNTSIISFRIDELVEARNRNKVVKVGWLTTNINSPEEDEAFDKLQKLKYCFAGIVDTVMVAFPAVQDKCYSAGVGVTTWGIQYSQDIKDIVSKNVPRLAVDNPSLPNLIRGQQNVDY